MRLSHPAHTLVLLAGAASSLAARAHAQRLDIQPKRVLADQPVEIRVTGLAPGQVIVLRASRPDSAGRLWQSYASFRADGRGAVDVARQAPVHGSYRGAHRMGLFTSMDVAGDQYGRLRYPVAWSDTLRTSITLEVDGSAVAGDTVEQSFAGSGVRAVPVRDRLVATLFLPGARGPRPGVLVIGGSEGGLSGEDVAAQLASHGFVALALAYFGVDPLPATLARIPLEYFARAASYLSARPEVQPGGIAILGTSKGAEAALLAAVHVPLLRAIVGYVPSSVAWSCICTAAQSSWTLASTDVPNVPAGADPTYRPPAGFPLRPAVHYRYRMSDTAVFARAAIAVEHLRAPLLLIAGGDDGLWPSLAMARQIMARRRRHRVAEADVLLEYPEAGHLIGKAYLPAGSTRVGGGRLETGGAPAANAAAQADSWPKVLVFLRRATGQP